MGMIKVKEGSGGGQFEVIELATPHQLVKAGEIESGAVVYDADTKQRVDGNTVLKPGHPYGITVQAEYGAR